MIFEYSDDNLVARCESTGEAWYLTCRDGEWIGEVGSCGVTEDGESVHRPLNKFAIFKTQENGDMAVCTMSEWFQFVAKMVISLMSKNM